MNKPDLPPVKRPEILGSGYISITTSPKPIERQSDTTSLLEPIAHRKKRGESCPICFGFHTFVGQACISPFIDWNAMLRKETHPICQTCHGIHHAGYACVNNQ